MGKIVKGNVLVATLILMVVLVGIAVAWSRFAVLNYRGAALQEARDQSFSVAEAGVEYVVALLNSGVDSSTLDGTPVIRQVGDGVVETELNLGANNIRATGWVGPDCVTIIANVNDFSGTVAGTHYFVESIVIEPKPSGVCLAAAVVPSPSP